ncbi:D-alanyl-D-alanine carboxypeptidase family protein [Streptomyces malaysiensis]|uniref:Serine hydrolase n=1 Tax=Streptomyces malaysiensis subsp. samsunensis TaxID=459658 RepID=A0A9X2M1K8_STRMQ|nr:serine hydrolase [Streptomyces samsunensis]MCQ8833215.1 serine hydrolase [Streptomyces samsunensis]
MPPITDHRTETLSLVGTAGPRLPSRRRYPGPRVAAAWAAGVVAVLVLVCLAYVRTDDHGPQVRAAQSVSWPAEGQASVQVEGLGSRGELSKSGAQRPVPIASVTKVMTAYVILRDCPLKAGSAGPSATIDEQAADESVSGVESTAQVSEGQRLSQRRLLELMLIPSGNNIARLLARWDSGTEDAFVAKMNRAARDLGMRHTTYTDASGISPDNTSTAGDQLRLARQVMRDATFRSVVAKPGTEVPGTQETLRNTNTLLGRDGVIGGKTGSSTPAGGNLMWAIVAPDRDGHDRLVLGVVLHQRADSSPEQGLESALDTSRTLIRDVRQWVSTTTREGGDVT